MGFVRSQEELVERENRESEENSRLMKGKEKSYLFHDNLCLSFM